MIYRYAKSNPGTVDERLYKNRLYQVDDIISGTTVTGEYEYNGAGTANFVPGQQINVNNQFSYDANGNLIKDKQAKIENITWTNAGKIKSITFEAGSLKPNLVFDYDAMGNRISKKSIDASGIVKIDFYSRDAQGNVLAVYTYEDLGNSSVNYTCKERNMYGSSRLGILNAAVDCISIPYWINSNSQTYPPPIFWNRTTGFKQFELSNHLGNVLAVVSDYKKPIINPSGYAGCYQAVVLTAQDYYPFGWNMPGRIFSSEGYRYGFNGKEKDKETLTQDYGFRIYNPALGKFLSVDPLTKSYPWYTPFQFAGNKPIWAVDLDGLEELFVTKRYANGKLIEEIITGFEPGDKPYLKITTTAETYLGEKTAKQGKGFVFSRRSSVVDNSTPDPNISKYTPDVENDFGIQKNKGRLKDGYVTFDFQNVIASGDVFKEGESEFKENNVGMESINKIITGFNEFSNKEKALTIITIGGEDDMELKLERADFIAKTLKENGVQGSFDYKYVNDKNTAFQIMSVPEGDE